MLRDTYNRIPVKAESKCLRAKKIGKSSAKFSALTETTSFCLQKYIAAKLCLFGGFVKHNKSD